MGQNQGFGGDWGQKILFARARPLVLYDFEKALIFWISQNAPLEPKGPVVTGQALNNQNAPSGSGKTPTIFFLAGG